MHFRRTVFDPVLRKGSKIEQLVAEWTDEIIVAIRHWGQNQFPPGNGQTQIPHRCAPRDDSRLLRGREPITAIRKFGKATADASHGTTAVRELEVDR